MSELNLDQVLQRLIRIAKFDTSVFQEIEHDQSANIEAGLVVVVSSLLGAVGAALSGGGLGGFLVQFVVGTLLNWLLWSYVTMLIGTRLFEGEADFWEMARTLGYANAPAALGILNAIPCARGLVGFVTWALSLVIGFLAVREALDLPTDKTAITVVVGWVVVLVVYIVLGATRILF